MGDGHGHGVRRVVGPDDLFLMQDHAHHFLNLVLIGLAVADNGLLDLHRRVFKQLFCIFGAGAQRNPARCRNIHAGGDIL